MTLSTAEKTIHDGQPIELYDFNITGGDQAAYFYTDHHEDLNVLGNTYISVKAIQRDVIMAADAEDAPEVTVEMPYDLGLVMDVVFKEPPRRVELEIRRYHGDIADVGLVWKGKVLNSGVTGRTAKFRVPSLLTVALRTVIPSVTYQTICNHVLYDTRCGLAKIDFMESHVVDTITNLGRDITVASLTAPPGDYIGGYLEVLIGQEPRLIVDAVGTTLTIIRPFRDLVITDWVNIFQGCNHKIATCHSQYANRPNNGGFPYIKTVDIFRKGISGSGI